MSQRAAPVWTFAKNSPSLGLDPRTFQSLESRYTNWAIPTLTMYKRNFNLWRSQMRKMGKTLLTAGFSFFLFIHHPHKRLENISIFFLFSPLQLSSQNAILGQKKYLRGIFPPPSWWPLSYAYGNMTLTTHLHLVPRLRMTGAIHLDPLHVSKARKVTTLPLSP